MRYLSPLRYLREPHLILANLLPAVHPAILPDHVFFVSLALSVCICVKRVALVVSAIERCFLDIAS